MDKKKQTPVAFAHKHGKTAIAELLLKLGAQDVKMDDKKKNKKKGGNPNNNDTTENNDQKVEEKLRKYILVRIIEGEKKVLTSKELEDFKNKYPDLADLLYNQSKIVELEQSAPEA